MKSCTPKDPHLYPTGDEPFVSSVTSKLFSNPVSPSPFLLFSSLPFHPNIQFYTPKTPSQKQKTLSSPKRTSTLFQSLPTPQPPCRSIIKIQSPPKKHNHPKTDPKKNHINGITIAISVNEVSSMISKWDNYQVQSSKVTRLTKHNDSDS